MKTEEAVIRSPNAKGNGKMHTSHHASLSSDLHGLIDKIEKLKDSGAKISADYSEFEDITGQHIFRVVFTIKMKG